VGKHFRNSLNLSWKVVTGNEFCTWNCSSYQIYG